MADIQLFKGTWTRQVLKGKRKVRITYIPDDVTQQSLSEKISIEDDSKTAWKKLLGIGNAVDIDLGIIVVRFNKDNKSGTATFLPNQSSQNVIVKTFQQSDPAFNVRAGYVIERKMYDVENQANALSGLTAGFSADALVGKNKSALGLQYAMRLAGKFGIVHSFGVTISLK